MAFYNFRERRNGKLLLVCWTRSPTSSIVSLWTTILRSSVRRLRSSVYIWTPQPFGQRLTQCWSWWRSTALTWTSWRGTTPFLAFHQFDLVIPVTLFTKWFARYRIPSLSLRSDVFPRSRLQSELYFHTPDRLFSEIVNLFLSRKK